MTGLIRAISGGKILPRSSRTQNPQHSIQRPPGITPTPATTIRPLPNFLIPLNERPDVLPLRFIQIGHDFYLQPILTSRKCLFTRYISEMGSSPWPLSSCSLFPVP